MKNSEIKALSDAELAQRLATEQQNYSRLKFAHAITPLENPMSIKASRKIIARIATEIRSRQIKQGAS